MKSESFSCLESFLYSKKNNYWIKFSDPKCAYLYKKKIRLNLLTNEEENYPIEKYCQILNSTPLFLTDKFKIHHLFFELGSHYLNLKGHDDDILAIELIYSKKENVLVKNVDLKKKLNFVLLTKENKKEYSKILNKVFEAIREGEFYQCNFTKRWKFSYLGKYQDYLKHIMGKKNTLGAMAHFTLIPQLKRVWFSNSPECLFQIEKKGEQLIAHTFPIKGTIAQGDNKQEAVKALLKSKKDLAELDMITDLMRNDLNKIEFPNAFVKKRRFVFQVPGLFHQASHIISSFSKNVTLGKIVESLFPGGSITGAPKKSTLKHILKWENTPRRFYCGTTIYQSAYNCSASINIRSAEFDVQHNVVEISAGGAITLKSNIDDEWQEMQNKKLSLTNLWKR